MTSDGSDEIALGIFADRDHGSVTIAHQRRERLWQIEIYPQRLQRRDVEDGRARSAARRSAADQRTGIEVARGDHALERGGDAFVLLGCNVRLPGRVGFEHLRVVLIGYLAWHD